LDTLDLVNVAADLGVGARSMSSSFQSASSSPSS
jgi:hypothetical protein